MTKTATPTKDSVESIDVKGMVRADRRRALREAQYSAYELRLWLGMTVALVVGVYSTLWLIAELFS